VLSSNTLKQCDNLLHKRKQVVPMNTYFMLTYWTGTERQDSQKGTFTLKQIRDATYENNYVFSIYENKIDV